MTVVDAGAGSVSKPTSCIRYGTVAAPRGESDRGTVRSYGDDEVPYHSDDSGEIR